MALKPWLGKESERERQEDRLQVTSALGRVRSETNCGKLKPKAESLKVEKVTRLGRKPPPRMPRPERDCWGGKPPCRVQVPPHVTGGTSPGCSALPAHPPGLRCLPTTSRESHREIDHNSVKTWNSEMFRNQIQ